jgi:hypothetical protein
MDLKVTNPLMHRINGEEAANTSGADACRTL